MEAVIVIPASGRGRPVEWSWLVIPIVGRCRWMYRNGITVVCKSIGSGKIDLGQLCYERSWCGVSRCRGGSYR